MWYLFMSFRRKTWKYVQMVLSVITVAPSTVKNVDYWTIPSVTELYPCLSSMLISFSIYLVCNAKILDVHEIISRWNSLNTLFSSWQNATTNILVTIIIMQGWVQVLESGLPVPVWKMAAAKNFSAQIINKNYLFI